MPFVESNNASSTMTEWLLQLQHLVNCFCSMAILTLTSRKYFISTNNNTRAWPEEFRRQPLF